MAIAQMNWGRMRFPLDDPRMTEFAEALGDVYRDAELHPGFIWRISDDDAAQQLVELGFDERTSATVSVWTDIASLKDYTFSGSHGRFLSRAGEWFETVDGPQLVIWQIGTNARPSFQDAFDRLEYLKTNGSSDHAQGWPKDR